MLTAIVETGAMINRLKCESLDSLGKSSKNKTEKSDIVHIWVLTHPNLPISDIQFSDIFY